MRISNSTFNVVFSSLQFQHFAQGMQSIIFFLLDIWFTTICIICASSILTFKFENCISNRNAVQDKYRGLKISYTFVHSSFTLPQSGMTRYDLVGAALGVKVQPEGTPRLKIQADRSHVRRHGWDWDTLPNRCFTWCCKCFGPIRKFRSRFNWLATSNILKLDYLQRLVVGLEFDDKVTEMVRMTYRGCWLRLTRTNVQIAAVLDIEPH